MSGAAGVTVRRRRLDGSTTNVRRGLSAPRVNKQRRGSARERLESHATQRRGWRQRNEEPPGERRQGGRRPNLSGSISPHVASPREKQEEAEEGKKKKKKQRPGGASPSPSSVLFLLLRVPSSLHNYTIHITFWRRYFFSSPSVPSLLEVAPFSFRRTAHFLSSCPAPSDIRTLDEHESGRNTKNNTTTLNASKRYILKENHTIEKFLDELQNHFLENGKWRWRRKEV